MTGPGGDGNERRVRPAGFEPPDQGRSAGPRRRFRPIWIILLVGLLLFAAAAWYLLSARSVGIAFAPVADHIDIREGLSIPFGGRYLMRPGEYRIQARKTGYEDFSRSVEIPAGEDPDFRFALEKLPGRIQLSSQPAGARVSIDGKDVGSTPLTDHKLAAGSHRIEIRAERHEVWAREIQIEGLDRSQSLNAELVPAWADISFSSEPAGASLFIDGKSRGSTPLTLEVGAGDHELRYSLDGYQNETRPLQVEADKPRKLETVELEKALGRLKVTSEPAGANVTLDGQFQGSTPLTVSLTPERQQTIKLSKAGYRTASRNVSLRAGQSDTARFELEAVLGEIRITARPADSRVFVNGKDRGAANQTLKLPAVKHQISVRSKGHVSHTVSVTPRPDAAQTLNISLKSEAQAKAQSTPARITTATGQSMLLIQPGRFTMGSPRREQGRRNNELQQPVKLTRAYYLSRHEVSNADYRQFAKRHSSGIIQRTTLDNDNYPVVRVSWDDATAFCNWLSERDGLPPAYAGGKLITPVATGYRLPTEAEWAYAARFAGNRALKYPWGASMPPTGRAGNYADQSAAVLLNEHLDSYDDGHRAAAPLGSFAANSLGLFDLGGNVSEWVNDRAGGLRLMPEPEQMDPLGQDGSGAGHRVRGSSWRHGRITELRLAWRDEASGARDDLGFRIARYAE